MARHIITLQARNCGRTIYNEVIQEIKRTDNIKAYAYNQINKFSAKRRNSVWDMGYKAAMIDVIEYIERGCQDEK